MTAEALTSEVVGRLYVYCVHRDGEPTREMRVAESVRSSEVFHAGRLGECRERIVQLLKQLPDSFRTDDGDVASNAHFDRYGNQWTGVPAQVDNLLALGVALEAVAIMGLPARWPDSHADPRVRVTLSGD